MDLMDLSVRPVLALAVLTLGTCAGCLPLALHNGQAEIVWGRRGVGDGRFQTPRGITIDQNDQLYVVDKSGRIQVFDTDGNFLHGWRTPEIEHGKPCGISVAQDGNILVADTHYFRVLCYTPGGELLSDRTLGGEAGHGPGQFGFVTDVVQDSHGNYFVSEYGEYDRIQMFTPDRQFVLEWGGHGAEPGQFVRPQSLAVDSQDHVWVADACNHRLQVFEIRAPEAQLVRIWGEFGSAPGQLSYPYGLAIGADGNIYVSEFGNHRIQKFTPEGHSLGCWGEPGRGDGELSRPWALAIDSRGRIHVVDTYNDRVQRIRL